LKRGSDDAEEVLEGVADVGINVVAAGVVCEADETEMRVAVDVAELAFDDDVLEVGAIDDELIEDVVEDSGKTGQVPLLTFDGPSEGTVPELLARFIG